MARLFTASEPMRPGRPNVVQCCTGLAPPASALVWVRPKCCKSFVLGEGDESSVVTAGSLTADCQSSWLYQLPGIRTGTDGEPIRNSSRKGKQILGGGQKGWDCRSISIEHRFARMVDVEENIRRRYNLSFCRTTPPLTSDSPSRRKPPPFPCEARDGKSDCPARGRHGCRGAVA